MILQEIVNKDPDYHYSIYTNLAQLSSGTESIDNYLSAIKSLKMDKEEQYKAELSKIYASIAETYLADFEYHLFKYRDDLSLQNCKKYLELSKEQEITVDYILTKVSYDLTTENHESALELLDNNFSLINKQSVSYENRLSASKLYLEVSQSENAIEILENLNLENDTQLEVWYLLIIAHYQVLKKQATPRRSTAEKCIECHFKLESLINQGEEEELEFFRETIGDYSDITADLKSLFPGITEEDMSCELGNEGDKNLNEA